MIRFTFTVNDESGLQAEQAGALVREAAKCSSQVTIRKGDKKGNAKRIFNVMSLSIKTQEDVEIIVEGKTEQEDSKKLEAFIRENI